LPAPCFVRVARVERQSARHRVEREIRRLARRTDAANDSALGQDERAVELHEARKAAKRARYAAEPLRSVYGDAAKALCKQLKRLQPTLGDLQDTVVTRDYLVEVSHSSEHPIDPAAALIAGALIEPESTAAVHYEVRAAKAWEKVAARQPLR